MRPPIEEWKNIEGYEGLYQVSNYGRVKSLAREWDLGNNKFRFHKDLVMKQSSNSKGYKKVTLTKNSVQRLCSVHRLVAKAFIPNPQNLPFVNHQDENPSNNSVYNLEWCTPKYNSNYGTARKRLREINLGKVLTEKQYNTLLSFNEDRKKKIEKINHDGSVEEFESICEAVKQGFHKGNLIECLKGKRKTCGGYKWRYKE